MIKHIYKRVLASIMAVLTAITMVPVSVTVSVFADTTTNSDADTLSMFVDKEIREYFEFLQYFETMGTDYSLPAIMLSEGDTVYIGDNAIATTTVPITKSLVNDQTKIKTQYWLDSMRVGDANALKADEIALVAYFNEKIGDYDAIKSRLQQKLVALRDYCIEHDITQQGLWDDAVQMTDAIQQVNGMVIAYGDGKQETTTWTYTSGVTEETASVTKTGTLVKYEPTLGTLYLAVDDSGYLNGAELPDANTVRTQAATYTDTKWATALKRSAGLSTFAQGLVTYQDVIEDDLYGLASILNSLIGDVNVDSETYIATKLADMGVDEMMYAYAALYTNLLRVSDIVDIDKY